MKKINEASLPFAGLGGQEQIAQALSVHGYGYIPFVPPPALIERVMRGWNDFLALPWEERIAWRCGDPADWDDGYVPREPGRNCPGCPGCASVHGGTEHDNKHFFHYRPYLTALLDHKHVDYSGHTNWLEALHSLYQFSRGTFHKVLHDLDVDHLRFSFAQRFSSPVAETRHVVRLLSYNEPMLPGQVLAKAHVDRNFATIQVYETHPALVLNLPEGKINYVPRNNQALMFTGAKAAILTMQRLHCINHAVIVPDDFVTQVVAEPRQSIVFFGHISPETM